MITLICKIMTTLVSLTSHTCTHTHTPHTTAHRPKDAAHFCYSTCRESSRRCAWSSFCLNHPDCKAGGLQQHHSKVAKWSEDRIQTARAHIARSSLLLVSPKSSLVRLVAAGRRMTTNPGRQPLSSSVVRRAREISRFLVFLCMCVSVCVCICACSQCLSSSLLTASALDWI